MDIGFCLNNYNDDFSLQKLKPESSYAEFQNVVDNNLDTTIRLLHYCKRIGVRVLRLDSEIIPLNLSHKYNWVRPNLMKFGIISKLAENMELCMQATSNVYLNAKRASSEIVSIYELLTLSQFLDLINKQHATIIIDPRGKFLGYKRLAGLVHLLPVSVKSKLAFKNTGKGGGIYDVLRLCDTCRRPFVLDYFNTYITLDTDKLTSNLYKRILGTWRFSQESPVIVVDNMKRQFYDIKKAVLDISRLASKDFNIIIESEEKELGALAVRNILSKVLI